MEINNHIFCWVFEEIIGGETFQTTDGEWVIRCNGDLYNKSGVIITPPQIAFKINIESRAKQCWEELCNCDRRGLSINEFYNEIVEFVEEIYDEREEEKMTLMASSISKKHELWAPKMLEDNYFALTSINKNQAYFLFLYSEFELDHVDRFLENAQKYATNGIVPTLFASGKVLWQNTISYAYVIYEKTPKIIGFDSLNTSKLSSVMLTKIKKAIEAFENALADVNLQTTTSSKDKFFFDRGTLKLYAKTPIDLRAETIFNRKPLVISLLE